MFSRIRSWVSGKEEYRPARGLRLADELRLDVRYACRSLGRTRGFTAVVLLLLALGIGANTAMFTLLDAVLWRMLPVHAPEQLVLLERFPGRVAGGFKKFCDISYPLMQALTERDPLLDEATTFFHNQVPATIGGQLEPVRTLRVADNFYTMLGVGAWSGRLIQRGDGTGPPVAVLSHGFWQRRFGGRRVEGEFLTIGGTPHAIVGIAAPAFFGMAPGSEFDVSTAIPARELGTAEGPLSDPRARPLGVVMGRLRPGARVEDATRSLTGLIRQMLVEERVQGIDAGNLDAHRIEARSMSRGIAELRQRVSRPLAALMALVVLVLLITSANVANLLLVRAAARQHELAIRLSIGAGRARLVRQLLTESLLLAFAGGAAGIAVAYWALQGLLYLLSTDEAMALRVPLSGRTLAFTAAVTLGTGVLFGLAPAWQASRFGMDSLARRGTHPGRPASLPSRLLVVAQVALSMVLLAGAGLFVRTFQNLVTFDAGFNRTNVLAVALDPQLGGLKGARVASLYREVLDRLLGLPAVQSASFERNRPLSGGGSLSNIRTPGFTGDDDLITWFEEVGPRYAETLGLRLIAGRDFTADDAADAPKVVAINAAAARLFFPGQDPLGRRMGRGPRYDDYEVVGVFGDVRHQNLREPPRVTVYLPALQDPQIRSTSILVRTTGDPLVLASTVRQIVGQLEPTVPIMSVTTLEQVAARALTAERLTATLASAFGLLALLIAGVGLSGVLQFGVARRTREFGVRMALGAAPRRIAAMVLRESTLVLAAGLAIGVPCALAAGGMARTLLFGLSPSDPMTIAASAATLVLAGVLASIWPARRAAGVDPLTTLKAD